MADLADLDNSALLDKFYHASMRIAAIKANPILSDLLKVANDAASEQRVEILRRMGTTAPQASPAPRLMQSGPDNTTKTQKLYAWVMAKGTGAHASQISQSLFGVGDIRTLNDEQAEKVKEVLLAAKPNPAFPTSQPANPKTPPFTPSRPPGPVNENGNPVKFGWPIHGGSLYAWAKKLEDHYKTSIIKSIDEWAKPKGLPRSYKEWDKADVEAAAIYMAKWIRTFPGYDGQFDAKVPSAGVLRNKLIQATSMLLTKFGSVPTDQDIALAIRVQSEQLPPEKGGGEVVDNLDACENAELLGALLAQVEADLADAKDGCDF